MRSGLRAFDTLCVQALRDVGLLQWADIAPFYSSMWLCQKRAFAPQSTHATFTRVKPCAAAGYACVTQARGLPTFLPKMLKVAIDGRVVEGLTKDLVDKLTFLLFSFSLINVPMCRGAVELAYFS